MRAGLDKAWGAPKKHLLQWGITLAVISWLWHPVLRTISYAFSRLMHVEVNQAINKNTVPSASAVVSALSDAPQKFTMAMLTTVPAPKGLKVEMLKGKMLHFTWLPVPGAVGYNFYSAHSWDTTGLKQENKRVITTTEGSWSLDEAPDEFKFAITALDAQDHESVYSDVIDVDFR